jgi:hypothetical protein
LAGLCGGRQHQPAAAVPLLQRPATAKSRPEHLQRQDLIGQECIEEFYVRVDPATVY